MKEFFLILFWKGYKVEVKKALDNKLPYLGKKNEGNDIYP